MPRVTYGRQDEIRASDTYDDTLTPGEALETDAVVVEDDFNALRSLRVQDFGLDHWWQAWDGSGGSGGGGVGAVVVAAVLAVSGPGAGVIPTQRTYDDGTVKDYTYKADGWTVDTMTITRPGDAPVSYQAQYAASGIRTHWTEI